LLASHKRAKRSGGPQPVRFLERPPWIRREKSADLIQLPKYEFDRCEIVLKLVDAFLCTRVKAWISFFRPLALPRASQPDSDVAAIWLVAGPNEAARHATDPEMQK
jgi:hypothetical protein